MSTEEKFIPALRFKWLTKLFDPFIRFTVPEKYLKNFLIENANLDNNHRILDLGCGTGTLTIMIKQKVPEAEVTGIDPDLFILEMAMSKIKQSALEINLEQGNSTLLPYEKERFDRVISSLVMHHLTANQKKLAFKEVYRVLEPGGEFHILDLSKPHNILMYLISLIFSHFEQTKENIEGLLPEFLSEAGFSEIKIKRNFSTMLGTIAIISAKKLF